MRSESVVRGLLIAAVGIGGAAGGCLVSGTYRFQVWARRAGSTSQFESSAQETFTLVRR